MAWPAYSPDLNPIENLWDALGRAVSSRFPPPSTLIELETALHEKWRLLNSAVVDHLIESMILRNQYPEQPPLAVITALIRLGIESDRDWMACTGTDAHAASTRCYNSSKVVTDVW
ncbi:transposable element Tcb2 transposase [Trichonephila clavipes]|nr:transposable element Tcb2 transposase [Trichonephila clavipes]